MSDIELGLDGGDVITDTTAHTPPDGGSQCWFAVLIIADAVLNTSGTTVNWNGLANLSGVTISAGTVLYGKFTAIQLASGKVIAYQKDV